MADKKPPRKSRRATRSLAIQALYSWQITKINAEELIGQFLDDRDMSIVEIDYFIELVKGVILNITEIDELYQPYLDLDINELTPVEQSILRLASFELSKHPEIPYRVVINEAVELSKSFGSTDGHKFINGVLDKAVKVIRPTEVKMGK